MNASLSKYATPSKQLAASPMPLNKKPTNDRRKRSSLASNLASTNSAWIPLQIASTKLDHSVDSITAKAETYFYNNEYKKSSEILNEWV